MALTKPSAKIVIPPESVFRKAVFSFVISQTFDLFMIVVIFLNMFTLFLVHFNMESTWALSLSISNVVFTFIFIVEMSLKMIAMGLKGYFRDGWCRFDFVVVCVSIAGVILDWLLPQSIVFLPLMRILRVIRLPKLIPKAKGLRMMMMTLYWSLPAFLNFFSVFFLLIFIYAIIGMNLFGNIKFQQNYNRDANFRTFPTAMLTLFRQGPC